MRRIKNPRYPVRHQGARECARRLRQNPLCHYPSLAALRRDRVAK